MPLTKFVFRQISRYICTRRTVITLFRNLRNRKALFDSRSCHLYMFSIRNITKLTCFDTKVLAAMLYQSYYLSIVTLGKSNSRDTETVSVHHACICKQTQIHIWSRLFVSKLFTKALQIAMKARNHEHNYQLSF